jgi:putative ABC transport system ATP-binding protein
MRLAREDAMNTAMTVREVTKTYTEGGIEVPALRGVDLDVDAGEITMLVGPSGSGKTTLLSIMGCILKPSSGSVRIAGQEVARLPESHRPAIRLRHIGFIFQAFNLFPTLTAGENVELMLNLKGVRKAEVKSRARELLGQMGIADKLDASPANLSGGQKQRVAIARALAGEPTAALDSRTGRKVLELLRDLAHKHHRAVVVVTHDPRVMEFADRVVRMEDGMIADSSSKTEVPLPLWTSHLQQTVPRGSPFAGAGIPKYVERPKDSDRPQIVKGEFS